jgi:2-polyprenyl-3-methyl-5-hydroxy-6-metoxy-1,4-benzoquinol methylase
MLTDVQDFRSEIGLGLRFAFGKNWASFLRRLDLHRIERAEESIIHLTELSDLAGKSFLDVGTGSGLFSLCARRLGAKVRSFDYDSDSVACTSQ